MASPADVPRIAEPIAGNGGFVTRAWLDFFLKLASTQTEQNLAELYAQLAARVAQLEDGQSLSFQLLGQGSIGVQGIPQPGGAVIITLQNDDDAPGNTMYYGTGPTGAKGWFSVSSAIAGTADQIVKTTGTDGVVTIGLADLPDSGTGTLLAITRDAKGRVAGTRAATITGTTNQIDVANGSAAAGLPTLSLAPAVVTSLGRADSAVQEVRPGTGVTVDNTDPRRPIVNATPTPSGVPEAPTDGWPYARGSATWHPLTGPLSKYVMLELPVLTDQAGNVLTDQQGRPLTANVPAIPWAWITGAPTYSFPPMTLAQANALTPVADGQPVLITDLAGGREPCWYDATVPSGTRFRRFSDRSIAN